MDFNAFIMVVVKMEGPKDYWLCAKRTQALSVRPESSQSGDIFTKP